jgi:hypothetical protein
MRLCRLVNEPIQAGTRLACSDQVRHGYLRTISYAFTYATSTAVEAARAGIAIDAFELRDGCPAGYEFQVIGEPDDDPLELLGKLIGKMRRALALTHIEDTDHGP